MLFLSHGHLGPRAAARMPHGTDQTTHLSVSKAQLDFTANCQHVNTIVACYLFLSGCYNRCARSARHQNWDYFRLRGRAGRCFLVSGSRGDWLSHSVSGCMHRRAAVAHATWRGHCGRTDDLRGRRRAVCGHRRRARAVCVWAEEVAARHPGANTARLTAGASGFAFGPRASREAD
jgi:hypothetical protein